MLNIIFYLFSIFLVISSFMVIISKHPIFSLLFLVLSFVFSSFLLFLLECEFLALLFIIVYVGAIGVLFLFAIMMLESKFSDLSKNVLIYISIGTVFGVALLLFILLTISENFRFSIFSDSLYLDNYQNWYDLIDSTTDVEAYGQVLYSYFILQFLFAGLILLLVLIGVVYLTNTYLIDKQTIEQSVFKQLAREFKFFIKN